MQNSSKITSESGSLPPLDFQFACCQTHLWSKILDVIVTITLLHPKLIVLGVTIAKEMENPVALTVTSTSNRESHHR